MLSSNPLKMFTRGGDEFHHLLTPKLLMSLKNKSTNHKIARPCTHGHSLVIYSKEIKTCQEGFHNSSIYIFGHMSQHQLHQKTYKLATR